MPGWKTKLFRALPTLLSNVSNGFVTSSSVPVPISVRDPAPQSMAFLKIKIKSLAEEAKMIRHEEGKHKKWKWVPTHIGVDAQGQVMTVKGHWQMRWLPLAGTSNQPTMTEEDRRRENRLFWELRNHRTRDVRQEARHALLAYGYIRGRTYRQMEDRIHVETEKSLSMSRVERIVRKFAPDRLKGYSKDEGVKVLAAWWRETRNASI